MVASNRNPRTLIEAMRHFTPEVADAYIAAIKWPEGPCCPKCGPVNVGAIKSRRRFQCREKGCRRQFSVTTDTILESTHLRSDQWVVAVLMILGAAATAIRRARLPGPSGASSKARGTCSTAFGTFSHPSTKGKSVGAWRPTSASSVG